MAVNSLTKASLVTIASTSIIAPTIFTRRSEVSTVTNLGSTSDPSPEGAQKVDSVPNWNGPIDSQSLPTPSEAGNQDLSRLPSQDPANSGTDDPHKQKLTAPEKKPKVKDPKKQQIQQGPEKRCFIVPTDTSKNGNQLLVCLVNTDDDIGIYGELAYYLYDSNNETKPFTKIEGDLTWKRRDRQISIRLKAEPSDKIDLVLEVQGKGWSGITKGVTTSLLEQCVIFGSEVTGLKNHNVLMCGGQIAQKTPFDYNRGIKLKPWRKSK